MDVTQLLPVTAWDQAVFASMFFLLVVYVFTWFQKVRKEDQQVRKEDQEFQANQQKEWQAFIEKVDDKWRAFNKEQRDCNNIALHEVENSVRDIISVTQGMILELKEMRSDNTIVYQMLVKQDDKSTEILQLIKSPQLEPKKKPIRKRTSETTEE